VSGQITIRDTSAENVVYLQDSMESIRVLKDIINDLRNQEVTDFIVMARVSSKGGSQRFTRFTWFGERSCIAVLGLLERMKMYVQHFIDEAEDGAR